LTTMKHKSYQVMVYAAVVLTATLLLPTAGIAQDQTTPPGSTAPDNSTTNKADKNTADQQSENAQDRQITQKIRRSLMADTSLSTQAHNCKIITRNGIVLLKGPVSSEDEKQAIAAKAIDVVGSPGKVNNQLTVKQ
jgi:hyperosmotically inducible protein